MEGRGKHLAGGSALSDGSVHYLVVSGTFEVRFLPLWEVVWFGVI